MATHAPARLTRARRAELLRGIYVILNETPQTIDLARAVLDAGIRLIQYRAKQGVRPESLRGLRELSRERDALLIVNDDWRAAVEFDCDGVHLGPADEGFATIESIRPAMRELLIGLSCGAPSEIDAANEQDVDYLGIGPVFATSSKSDAGAPLHVERSAPSCRRCTSPRRRNRRHRSRQPCGSCRAAASPWRRSFRQLPMSPRRATRPRNLPHSGAPGSHSDGRDRPLDRHNASVERQRASDAISSSVPRWACASSPPSPR